MDFMTKLTIVFIVVGIVGTLWLCGGKWGGSKSERIYTEATDYGPGWVKVRCDAAGSQKLASYLNYNVASIESNGTHSKILHLRSHNIETARSIYDAINRTEENLL